MKIGLLALIALIAGVGVGFGTAWYDLSTTPAHFEPYRQVVSRPVAGHAACDGEPRVEVVDGTSFDFGSGQRNSRMKHTFEIRNLGDAPLALEEGHTTCACTWSDLGTGDIPPGESAHFTLEWTVEATSSVFRQTAELYTNDPRTPTVLLEIHGDVVDRFKLEPEQVVLSDISASDGSEVDVWLYGYGVSELEVTNVRYSNPVSADFFDLQFSEAEAPADKTPRPAMALRGRLRAKPGLPLGPINQTIHLDTNDADVPELELRVSGRVSSDISVVGPGTFRPQLNLLMWGPIDSREGAETTLRILVRGPHRHDTQLTVAELDPPDVLTATLGEPTAINQGAVYMYPMTISIPPGARHVNRMGTDRGAYGRVLVETNHPAAKSVPVHVRFAVK